VVGGIGLKLSSVVLLLVVVAAAAYGVYWYQQGEGDRVAAGAREYLTENKASALKYNDNVYGFSFEYPDGYDIGTDSVEGFRVHFSAGEDGEFPEIFTVLVGPEEDAAGMEAEFKLIENISSFRRFNAREGTAIIVSYNYTPDYTYDAFFFRQAYYPCSFANGSRYGALLTAMVPQTYAADVKVADLFVESFEC